MKDQGKCIFKIIDSASIFPNTFTLYETCKMIDTDGKRVYKGSQLQAGLAQVSVDSENDFTFQAPMHPAWLRCESSEYA